MIIGVTGYLASGKDTVADYLIKKGFNHYSLSDKLREILKKRQIEINRDNLREVANQLRQRYGSDFLAKKIIKKIKMPAVVTSIRTTQEVKTLKKNGGFYLIFVDAPLKLRFERLKKRGRENDETLTMAKFKTQEKSEKSNDKFKQQLTMVAKIADFKIINNKDLKSLYKNVDKIIGELKNAPKKEGQKG